MRLRRRRIRCSGVAAIAPARSSSLASTRFGSLICKGFCFGGTLASRSRMPYLAQLIHSESLVVPRRAAISSEDRPSLTHASISASVRSLKTRRGRPPGLRRPSHSSSSAHVILGLDFDLGGSAAEADHKCTAAIYHFVCRGTGVAGVHQLRARRRIEGLVHAALLPVHLGVGIAGAGVLHRRPCPLDLLRREAILVDGLTGGLVARLIEDADRFGAGDGLGTVGEVAVGVALDHAV